MWGPNFPFAPKKWPFFYGWVIVAVGTMGVVASIPAQTLGVGVFTEVLIESLGLSRVQLSFAYLIGTIGSGLLLPRCGRWMDAVGLRRSLVLSSVFLGLSLLLMSASDKISMTLGSLLPWVGATAVAVVVTTLGFFFMRFWGQGALTLASRNLVGKWFNHNRGLAVGISGVATSVSFSLSPIVLNAMVESLGWRLSWMVLGLLASLVVAGLGWLLARDNPEECDLPMDGYDAPPTTRKANLDMVIYREYTRADALRTGAFWIFSLSFAWHALLFTAYAFHFVDIGTGLEIERTRIFALFFYAALISIPVNLAAGWLSSRLRLKYLLFVQNLGTALMAFALLGLAPASTEFWIVVSMGISGGLWSNLFGTIYPRFFGRAELGAISGFGMSLIIVSSALGPYLFSLSDIFADSYRPAFWVACILSFILVVAATRADNPQRRLAATGPEKS